MKIGKIAISTVLIIFITLFSISICFIKTHSQYRKALVVINEYKSNSFFSALGYFNELDNLLSVNKISTFVDGIDYHITSFNNVIFTFSQIPLDYNRIYSTKVQQPQFLLKWLTDIKYELANCKNGNKMPEADLINDIKSKLYMINNISKTLYDFHNGLPEYERERLRKTGFLKDARWVQWMNEVEDVISL